MQSCIGVSAVDSTATTRRAGGLSGGCRALVQRVSVDQIGNLEQLGHGGQGIVYRAPSVRTTFAKSMVYKEYKPATLTSLDVGALEAMPAFLEDLPYRDGARLISLTAWPCAIVDEAGKTAGFLMPAIPDEFFTDMWTNKSTPSKVMAEFQHLLNDPQVLAMRFRGAVISDRQRLEILRQAVLALSFLHERGVCVGDISPRMFSIPSVRFLRSTSSTATQCGLRAYRCRPRSRPQGGPFRPVKKKRLSTRTATSWASWLCVFL